MKYAIFDERGFPKAFYDKTIHGDNIPTEAIEITDEQWLEFINNQGRRKWDFKRKKVVRYRPSLSLEELKERRVAQLRNEVKEFIYDHYGQGTQSTLLWLYQNAKDTGNTEVINAVQKVWSWIGKVMEYYYAKKAAILNAASEEELDSITWDWGEVEEERHVDLVKLIRG